MVSMESWVVYQPGSQGHLTGTVFILPVYCEYKMRTLGPSSGHCTLHAGFPRTVEFADPIRNDPGIVVGPCRNRRQEYPRTAARPRQVVPAPLLPPFTSSL